MEIKMKILDLKISDSELSSLLSVSTYGADYLYVKIPKEYKDLVKDVSIREDAWAKVITSGGYLIVYDVLAEATSIEDAYVNDFSKAVSFNAEDGSIGYKLNMESFKKAIEKNPFLVKKFEEILYGSGDFYTAYNFMQIVLFGEEIYG